MSARKAPKKADKKAQKKEKKQDKRDKKSAKKAAQKEKKKQRTQPPIGVRQRMIAEAAYMRAESRNFQGGDPVQDWLEAEKQVDSVLQGL